MTTGLTSPPASTRRDDIILLVVTTVALGLVLSLVAPVLRAPPQVARITIENPQPYPAHIEINAPGDHGWLGIGYVDRDNEQSYHSIIDQGEVWIVRFTYAGHLTDLRVTRRQLAEGDWRITVPDDFTRRLHDARVPEAPTD